MTFFNKIFNRTKALNSSHLPEQELVHNQDMNTMEIDHSQETFDKIMTNSNFEPSQDIFVDNTAPISKQSNDTLETGRNSLLGSFFAKDYGLMGQNDGFEFHTYETLSLAQSKIKSEFVFCVDQVIEERRNQIVEILNTIVKIGELPEIQRMLANQLQDLEDRITTLKDQKELSVDNEGWVMKAIYDYKLGFEHGLKDWISSEGLLRSISNI